MTRPLLSILAILGVSHAVFTAVSISRRRWGLRPEMSRKLLHVGMGLLVVPYPWVFDRAWPVLLLSIAYMAALWMGLAMDELRYRIAPVIYGVNRRSGGEFWFPLAVGALFVLSGGRASLFCIPVLLLTVADAAAALVGGSYGRCHFAAPGGRKTVEGSAAFFVCALLITHTGMTCAGTREPGAILASLLIAAVATLLEAFSPRGLDNLLVPLGGFVMLRMLAGG